MEIHDLTPAQCVLLAVHLASESNIKALHSFTPNRLDALDPELVLRIVLTYLPETENPRDYANYVEEVASRLYVNTDREDVEVNTSSVKDISDELAQKRVKKLHLLQIIPPAFPPHAPDDLFTRFLCHRAYRIDQETGLLNLVPALIEPYLDRNDFLRKWYISVILPLLRMEIDYYPDNESLAMPLAQFEKMSGREGVDLLLQNVSHKGSERRASSRPTDISRDIKSLVGPWMYGHSERKRRRLNREPEPQDTQNIGDLTQGLRKISLEGVKPEDKTGHDWEYLYQWLVTKATDDFDLVTQAIEEWDGPSDVDLGGFDEGGTHYLDEDLQRKLELQYAQTAFASCYSAQADSIETVRAAHGVLARLADLLDFVPPPDLATSVDTLPKIERHITQLEDSQTVADLLPRALMRPEHPLTTPRMETYMLLQMIVYSAYQFSSLNHPISLVNVVKLHFYSTAQEQRDVLGRILYKLSKTGSRKDESQWTADREKLLWLWNWGIEAENENADEGAGVLGKIRKDDFEEEMLKVFTETSCYHLVETLFVSGQSSNVLSPLRVEQTLLSKVMEAYDGASNGNRTRGGVKKASDIIAAFRPYFKNSKGFEQADALIAATHALSFYSLTLQHGIPFQPVSIRVSSDSIALINKVLEQNSGSYTKLDDLVGIARNLIAAGLASKEDDRPESAQEEPGAEQTVRRRKDAERRVTFMAIEAALREDDFETAYSYIVNRLTPPSAEISAPDNAGIQQASSRKQRHVKSSSRSKSLVDDDISWRAAFLAGRYRPSASSPPTLRRLEQRTELLSLALLLAPVPALTEILAAWRRCEEEMTSLQLSQQQAEDEFDDRADKRLSAGSSALPGNFTIGGEQPELILNQKRREMGRMGAVGRGDDDAPVSMFDLTRNAARAFSKNAFPLGDAARHSGEYDHSMHERTGSVGSERPLSPTDGQHKVRKRDMVANAVSGGLASGIGWMLGATPVNQQQQQMPER